MADEKKIGPGVVVQLKSGGPHMTVECRTPSIGEKLRTSWRCTWFNGNTKTSDDFEEVALDFLSSL